MFPFIVVAEVVVGVAVALHTRIFIFESQRLLLAYKNDSEGNRKQNCYNNENDKLFKISIVFSKISIFPNDVRWLYSLLNFNFLS
jgi:hypothetical protein